MSSSTVIKSASHGGASTITVKPSIGGRRRSHSRSHSRSHKKSHSRSHRRKSHSRSHRRKSHGGNPFKNLLTGGNATPADLNIFRGSGAGSPGLVSGGQLSLSNLLKGGKRHHSRRHSRRHSRSHKMSGGGEPPCAPCGITGGDNSVPSDPLPPM